MSEQVTYRRFSGSAAENYERYFVPTIATAVASEVLDVADLRPGERVLDLACGTGIIARLAALQVGSAGAVVGVDVAPDMIHVARSIPPPPGAEVEWRHGNAEAIPVPDNAFDVVVCQLGLMFFDDKAAALSETCRVLAPDGRLVVATSGSIQSPFEIMEEALARHITPDLAGFVRAVFSMDDPSELERLLREAGFGQVETRTPTTLLRLPSPADFLWQYINLTPMGAVVANASEEAHQALEKDVVARWQEFVDDGSTLFEQPLVIATGRASAHERS